MEQNKPEPANDALSNYPKLPNIDILAEKMRVKVNLDQCRHRSIIGKLGDIVEGMRNDLDGYYIALMFDSARKLHTVLKTLRCTEVTQEGDTEAVIFLSHQNAMSLAEDLRSAIKVRKRPNLSIQQRQQKAVSMLQVRADPDHLVGLAA